MQEFYVMICGLGCQKVKNMVKLVKFISIITIFANLFGCKAPKPDILDGPGMVYVDGDYRTEYANTLPFDEYEGYPFWAVVYLSEEKNTQYYIDKLFSGLSEESKKKIKQYDFGGNKMYLIIPRYADETEISKIGDAENSLQFYDGTPFVLKCGTDIKICIYTHGGHEFTPQTDENGKLICTEDVWDITEYKQ